MPAAGDSTSRPAQPGLQRRGSPRSRREQRALRAPALPRVRAPYHGCSPGRASSAWTAPERPAAGAASRPRRTAGPRPPPRVRTGRGRGLAGGGASRPWGGACPQRSLAPARVPTARGGGSVVGGGGHCSPRPREAQGAQGRSAQRCTGHLALPYSAPKSDLFRQHITVGA